MLILCKYCKNLEAEGKEYHCKALDIPKSEETIMCYKECFEFHYEYKRR